MEIGEGTEEAARRETLEEAGAQVTIVRLHSVLSLPHIGQVYLTFIGHLDAEVFEAGVESLDVRLFERQDIPWGDIAFPVVKDALRRYVDDVVGGTFRLHVADLPTASSESSLQGVLMDDGVDVYQSLIPVNRIEDAPIGDRILV